MSSLVEPHQSFVFSGAQREKLLAFVGKREYIFFSIEEQNAVVGAKFLEGRNGGAAIDVNAAVFVNHKHYGI